MVLAQGVASIPRPWRESGAEQLNVPISR